MIEFKLDRDKWDELWDIKKDWDHKKERCMEIEIYYTVYMPKGLILEGKSITGNYDLTYSGMEYRLKTISGDIDLKVPSDDNLDISMKTISGEVYTDLDFTFPDGKEGLHQIVGTNAKGRLGIGGKRIDLETISGNIFLRSR